MGVIESVQKSLNLLVSSGSRIGLAVSGGADSMAMLYILSELRPASDLFVLHVDHRLRPDSHLDAEFVVAASSELGIESSVLTGEDCGPGEAAARNLRYSLLDSAASDLGLDWIATAHTRDDQAETVLARLMRGAGAKGLSGIPSTRGRYVRPLLEVARQDLRDYLESRGLVWRQDPTNEDATFERNWIRSVVLPELEARRPGVAERVARHASLAAIDEDFIATSVSDALRVVHDTGRGWVVPSEVMSRHPAVTRRVVRELVGLCGGNVDHDCVERVMSIESHGVEIGNGAWAWPIRSGIAFLPGLLSVPAQTPVGRDSEVDLEAWSVSVRVSAGQREAWAWRCRLDDVRHGLQLRSRRPGDRVRTPAGSRTVSDVLTDAKVPRFLRDSVPVLCDGDDPVAVVGLSNSSSKGPIVVDARPSGPRWGEDWWTTANLQTS